MDHRPRRERLEKGVRDRAVLNPDGSAPDRNSETFVTPDMPPEEKARLEIVARRLGEWWSDPDPDAPIPDLPGSVTEDFHEANRAYKEHFGESVPHMQLQVSTMPELARAAWKAIKRGEPIEPPELPPGAVT